MNRENEGWLKRFLKTLRMNEQMISMILGGVVVVVVGILVYNYFSSVNKPETTPEQIADEGVVLVEENGQLVPEDLPKTHIVQKGEHLWQIAEKYYGTGYNWTDIASENALVNPNLLVEGQELVVPKKPVKMVEPKVEEAAMEKPGESILGNEYVVQKGDFLWEISVKAYGDGYQWTKIWEANKDKIVDPNLIEKGIILKLPR